MNEEKDKKKISQELAGGLVIAIALVFIGGTIYYLNNKL